MAKDEECFKYIQMQAYSLIKGVEHSRKVKGAGRGKEERTLPQQAEAKKDEEIIKKSQKRKKNTAHTENYNCFIN